MKSILLLITLIASSFAYAAANHANVLSLNAATTNVTTSAYVQLVASSPVATTNIVVSNSTGQVLVIAFGASGSEIDQIAVAPTTGLVNLDLGSILPAGSRVSVEALGASATTGFVTVSLIP